MAATGMSNMFTVHEATSRGVCREESGSEIRECSLRSSKLDMSAVIPGRRTRMVLDVTAFIACLLLTMAQLAILDFYFIHYLKDELWYAWIAGDVLVLAAFLACLVCAIRYNRRCMEEVCNSDANLKFAWLAWLVYSLVLAGKVAVTFRLFHDDISSGIGFGSVDEIFGRHTFKLTLSLTAVIFLLMVESHHYTALASPRQLYLTYLATAITLDILDSILFLDLLWDTQVIFLLMVESHHYTALASPSQLYLIYLATAITLDILDSILFLDLLWDTQVIFLLMVESHYYTALASPRQLYLTYLATAITLDILDSILFLDSSGTPR